MDNDKFDKTDPANTPHAFVLGQGGLTSSPCNICSRGSGHHVHDVSVFPGKRPHKFAAVTGPGMDYGLCSVCGECSGHALHEEWARQFGEAYVSARALRWVKGAPEPERHAFKLQTGSLRSWGCAECGELEGNGNVHTDPPAEPHVFERGLLQLGFSEGECKVCGGQEDDGKAHRAPVELDTEQTDVRRVTTAGGITYDLVNTTPDERHVFLPGSDEPGDYPYETCAVCGGQEDDGKRHFEPELMHGPPTHPVNHPAHYTAHPSGIECIQITEHMSFTLGNAVKYIWRADLKGDAVADLEKAVWYLKREIDRRNGK